MKKGLCNHGTCTSCGGAVAWMRDPRGYWRLVEAGLEHECPAGGYSASRRAASRAGGVERPEMVEAALADQLRATNGAGENK
jgi:hypothetical protein